MALKCGNTTRNFTGTGQAGAPVGINIGNLAQQATARAIQDATQKASTFLSGAICPLTCGSRSTASEVTSVTVTHRITRNARGIATLTFRAAAVIKVTVKCKSSKSLIDINIDKVRAEIERSRIKNLPGR